MSSIRIIDENGDFATQEVTTGGVTFELDDGTLFSPAVVDRLEFDHEGEISTTTFKNCQRVENRRESDKKPDLAIEGIVTESQLRALKELDEQRDLTITSDLHSGPIATKRVTIEQNTTLVEFIKDGEAELAFRFQAQVRVSQYEDTATAIPVEDTVYAFSDPLTYE